MFGYGIFVIVVTILFIIYYMVVISMDLSKMKKKSDGEEIIHVDNAASSESPTVVTEHDDGSYTVKRPGEEERDYASQMPTDGLGQGDSPRQQPQAGVGEAVQGDGNTQQPSQGDDSQEGLTPAEQQLQQEAQAAEEQCDSIKTEIDGGVTAGEEADDEIERLAAEFAANLDDEDNSLGVK